MAKHVKSCRTRRLRLAMAAAVLGSVAMIPVVQSMTAQASSNDPSATASASTVAWWNWNPWRRNKRRTPGPSPTASPSRPTVPTSPATPSSPATPGSPTAPTSPTSTTGPTRTAGPPSSASTAGWNPPSQYTAPLASVWSHQESTYNNGNLYAFNNYLFDQVMAGKGSINYCVRWDSKASATAALRDQIQSTLQRQFQKWVDQLAGWNAWPYPKVSVKVVGWATRDRNQLQWTDNPVDVYVNDIREDAPECGQPCGRYFHQDGNYPNCPGGPGHHYDMSLWLTDGFGGGHGGDWGQRVGKEYFLGAMNQEDMNILLHEIGHGWGLDDFYDWNPLPNEGFLMHAGNAPKITTFDSWMLRDWWRHLSTKRYKS